MTDVTVPRQEYDELVRNVREMRTRHERADAQDQAIQTFAQASANQIVYTEIAKTALFTGDRSVSIDKWLRTIKNVLDQCSAEPSIRAKLLCSRLSADAALHARTLTDAQRNDYSQLQTALRQQYQTAADKQRALAELCTRKQRANETTTHYAQALKNLAKIAHGDDALTTTNPAAAQTEATLRQLFLAGLPPGELQRSARLWCPDGLVSLDSVVSWVVDLQSKLDPADTPSLTTTAVDSPANPFALISAIQSTTLPPRPSTNSSSAPAHRPFCMFCGRQGHWAATCAQNSNARLPTTYQGQPRRNPPSFLPPQPRYPSPNPTTLCYSCNQPGHIQRFCPNRHQSTNAYHHVPNQRPPIPSRAQNNTFPPVAQNRRQLNTLDLNPNSSTHDDTQFAPHAQHLLEAINTRLTRWEQEADHAITSTSPQIHTLITTFPGTEMDPPTPMVTTDPAPVPLPGYTNTSPPTNSSSLPHPTPLDETPTPDCKKVLSTTPQPATIHHTPAQHSPTNRSCLHAPSHTLLAPLALLPLLTLLFLPINMAHVTNYHICGGSRTGSLIAYPRIPDCTSLTPSPNSAAPIIHRSVKVFVPRITPIVVSAFSCRIRQQQVCTFTSFFGGKGIISDTLDEFSIPPQTCHDLAKSVSHGNSTTLWHGHTLRPIADGVWSTQQYLHVSYKWCCYTYCQRTTNLILEKGQVASLHGQHLQSDLADVGHCPVSVGHCQTSHSTIIWNQTSLLARTACPFQPLGTYPARQHQHLLIIDKLQAAYTLTTDPPQYTPCIGKHHTTQQGGVRLRISTSHTITTNTILHPTDTPRPHMPHHKLHSNADPVNGKLQYLTHIINNNLLIHFQALWIQFCSLQRTLTMHTLQLFRIDATLGARALLKRDDIFAQYAGDAIMVWQCRNVTITHIIHSHQIKTTCYEFTPVYVNCQ